MRGMDGGRVLLSPIADSSFATVWGTFDQAENSKQKGPQSGQARMRITQKSASTV
jgi:hypothetical protein